MAFSPVEFSVRTSHYPMTIEIFKLPELSKIETDALLQPKFDLANLPQGARKIFSQVIEANKSIEVKDGSGGGRFYLLKGAFDSRNITQIWPRQEIKEGQFIQFSGIGFSFIQPERAHSPAANASENGGAHSSQASSASGSSYGSSVESLIEAGFVQKDQNGEFVLNEKAIQRLEEDFRNRGSEED